MSIINAWKKAAEITELLLLKVTCLIHIDGRLLIWHLNSITKILSRLKSFQIYFLGRTSKSSAFYIVKTRYETSVCNTINRPAVTLPYLSTHICSILIRGKVNKTVFCYSFSTIILQFMKNKNSPSSIFQKRKKTECNAHPLDFICTQTQGLKKFKRNKRSCVYAWFFLINLT